jgi:hypothetical protein
LYEASFFCLSFLSFFFSKNCKQNVSQQVCGSIMVMEPEFDLIFSPPEISIFVIVSKFISCSTTHEQSSLGMGPGLLLFNSHFSKLQFS